MKEVNQLTVQQTLAHEDHHTHGESSEQCEDEPEREDAMWNRRIRQRPGSEDWKREYGDHSTARYPYSVGRRGFALPLRFAGTAPQSDQSNPGRRDRQWNVVETSAVIDLVLQRPVRKIGTAGVEQAEAKQIRVQGSPTALATFPGDGQSD